MADPKKRSLGPPPTDPVAQQKWLTALQEIVEVGLGQRGDGLHRFVEVKDLGDLNLADVTGGKDGGGSGGTGGGSVSGSGSSRVTVTPVPYAGTNKGPIPGGITYSQPRAVTNVIAYGTNDGAASKVMLIWDNINYSEYGGAEIYRAGVDNFGVAVKIGTVGVGQRMYVDSPVDEAGTYYYWVRSLSTYADAPIGGLNSPSGTLAIFDADLVKQKLHDTALEGYQLMIGIAAANALFDQATISNLTIGDTIQSDDYVPGVSGWIIKK